MKFYQLDQHISLLMVVGWYFFIFVQILNEHSVSKQRRLWSELHSVASDLGLHCLPMSHKEDACKGVYAC